MKNILRELQKKEEQIPDKHDGSYELVRETAKALKTIDEEDLGIEDLNMLYFSTIGTWARGSANKKINISRSNLPEQEKEILKKLVDKLKENAKQGLYENSSSEKADIGMFGTGIGTLKVNKEGIKRFINLCINIVDVDDEENILDMAEKALTEDIRGLGIASVSQILHCIKPYVFPVLNDAADAGIAAYKKIGLNLNKPSNITHYIENVRLIKKFRDENCKFKNYRILDTFFWFYNENDNQDVKNGEIVHDINITKEQWIEMLTDSDVFRSQDIKLVLKIYDMGGQATASQLAQIDDKHPSAYNTPVVALSKRIHNHTNCVVPKYSSDNEGWWHVPFNGRYIDSGHFSWILRPELKDAIEEKYFELKKVSNYVNDKVNYWWLNANPKIWSFNDIEIGESIDYTSRNERGNKRKIYKNFEDVKKGDIVIGYESTPVKAVVAIGQIPQEHDGERIWVEKLENLIEPVEYSYLKTIVGLKDMEFFQSPQGSLFKLTAEEYETIMDIVREVNPPPIEITNKKYTKEDFLGVVFMEEKQYDSITRLLGYKMNIILQGPPGVGKTFVAKRIAYSIMGEKDDSRIEMIQFHQSYSYEDFIMGYRPVENGFKLKYGVFYRFCKRALNDPDRPYFFIIDEINRGNISKIFGELMMLIESDKRGKNYAIPLTYTESKFHIPENVYIIGTMNTADRSIAMLDYALRRRFTFVYMKPAFNNKSFKQYLKNKNGDLADKIIKRMTDLNTFIENDITLGKGYSIGHSYFCTKNDKLTEEDYKDIIQYEILPLLSEYWFDDPDKVDKWETKLLEG